MAVAYSAELTRPRRRWTREWLQSLIPDSFDMTVFLLLAFEIIVISPHLAPAIGAVASVVVGIAVLAIFGRRSRIRVAERAETENRRLIATAVHVMGEQRPLDANGSAASGTRREKTASGSPVTGEISTVGTVRT